MPGLWQVTGLPTRVGHNKGAREEGQRRGGDGKRMRGATGRTKRPRRRNKGPGVESRGGQRGKTKRPGPGALAGRGGDNGREEQSCTGPPGRARWRRAGGTAPEGPARPAALTPAPAGLAAASRPHAPEPEPRQRRGSARSHAAAAAAAALGARDAAPAGPRTPSALRPPNPPLAAGCQTPATFPVPSAPIPSDLPCHNRRHLPQTLAKTPTLARFPPTPSLVPLPRPFPFSSLLDSTQPPRSLSPRRRREEPDASRRPQSRGSCSLPPLETYPSDGACAGGSSAGEPSVWSMGSAPVIQVLGRALRDVRGD